MPSLGMGVCFYVLLDLQISLGLSWSSLRSCAKGLPELQRELRDPQIRLEARSSNILSNRAGFGHCSGEPGTSEPSRRARENLLRDLTLLTRSLHKGRFPARLR